MTREEARTKMENRIKNAQSVCDMEILRATLEYENFLKEEIRREKL